jgi:polysaccharide export outer membrane protein
MPPVVGQTVAAVSPSATSISIGKPAEVSKVAPPDYQVGVDDVLNINVWKEPDLCRVIPVRPDGKITLPLIGDIQATGKTPIALQQEIHDRLTSFMSVPEVTVIVQEVKSMKFNIVGQVAKPGSYPLSEPTTVLDAIAQAGGLGVYAKSSNIYVLRTRPDGSAVKLPFHYKQVLKGANSAENVRLQSRDTVVVP